MNKDNSECNHYYFRCIIIVPRVYHVCRKINTHFYPVNRKLFSRGKETGKKGLLEGKFTLCLVVKSNSFLTIPLTGVHFMEFQVFEFVIERVHPCLQVGIAGVNPCISRLTGDRPAFILSVVHGKEVPWAKR